MDIQTRRVWKALKDFFKDRFNLKEDQERESVTKADIAKGTEFKGANLWILMFAIIIASIGLNVNSTAVIIGAMLISPLMGPIMGIGLGVAVYDIPLIIKGGRNLLIAVIISIATSTLYFLVTPLVEVPLSEGSELFIRTSPTMWDVLIAFSGGLAGIIAGSRKEKSNAIPGVAIATALMPPLCTAGYALATAQWYFFFGAMYLFFINCVFISVGTFLIVRLLKYRQKKFDNPKLSKRVHTIVTVAVIITMVPSILLAINLVRKTIFEQNAKVYVSKEFQFPQTEVIEFKAKYNDNGGNIKVVLFGKKIDESDLEIIKAKMTEYKLRCDINITQAYDDNEEDLRNLELISQNMKAGLIEDLYRKNEEVLESKDQRIKLLEDELFKLQASQYPVMDISEELRVQYDDLEDFTVMDGYIRNVQDDKMDTVCFARVSFVTEQTDDTYERIRKWLQLRLDVDSIHLIRPLTGNP